MAITTRVDLLRHGETAGMPRLHGARSDPGLSARGWEQLERASADGRDWTVLVSSPQARCRRFAESLADRMGAPLHIDGRLREYDFGDWDGRRLAALWREQGDALAAFLGDPDAVTPPNGEPAAAFRERVRAAWDDLLARHAGERVLVLGHGGVLRQLVADAVGAGTTLHARLEWPHAAMSRVRVVEDPPAARAHTLVWHGRTVSPAPTDSAAAGVSGDGPG